MKELSLNILDVAENSTKAEAEVVEIKIVEDNERLTIKISDDGTGMTEEALASVADPFYTTRTTRKVGMGIPLFRFAAEQTGGYLAITSKHVDSHPDDHGTIVTAVFNKAHIDFTPLGDIPTTLQTMIQGHPDVDYVFTHAFSGNEVSLDTREIRSVLDDIPLDSYEILLWIKENLTEQYDELYKN